MEKLTSKEVKVLLKLVRKDIQSLTVGKNAGSLPTAQALTWRFELEQKLKAILQELD